MVQLGVGRFPRTLIDLQSTVVSVSLIVSSEILEFLFRVLLHVPQSATFLDIIEGVIGAKGLLYLSEAVVTGQFAFLLLYISCCGIPHRDLELLRNNRFFVENIESHMPHVLRWYQAINSFDLKRRLLECRDVLRSGPSIFDRTPAESTRRHSVEITRGLWRRPPAAGKVRLHFFQTYHGQRYNVSEGNLFQHPDVRIDLPFDSNHGINLGKARKLLGVEKLSVITGLSPYRVTFDPIDRDRLSPLAVYDLSKQLLEPIRVFEPSPSRITKIKRKIHNSVSLSTYLLFTLFRACLGFTLRDDSYLAVTFGETFAARCAHVSRSIHPLNVWTLESVHLIAHLCVYLVLLPVVNFCKTVVFVQSLLFFATRSALALLISLLVTVRDIFSSLLCLSWKARIMIFVLSWITLTDFLPQSRNP